jgi:hypothetical protein
MKVERGVSIIWTQVLMEITQMTETETDQKLIVDLFLSIHISQLPKYSRQIFQLWTRGQYLYTHQRGKVNEDT